MLRTADGEETMLKIYQASKPAAAPEGAAGQLRRDKKHLYIGCTDGMLQIDSLQLSGKKRMDAQAFLNGMADVEKFCAN